MTTKYIKLWLIGVGLLVVAARIFWVTYMAPQNCLESGGTWNATERTCVKEPPAAG